MVSETWWPSNHEFESHHSYLFNKNQAQDNMSLYKSQVQMTFTWNDVLKNNINHILKAYLTT
jgi:hypothetical protein